MITAKEWDAYNEAVSKIADGAAASVEKSVLAWCDGNPGATVAEAREAAKLIMDGEVQGYDELASSFAAAWYDHQAESNGVKLDQAVTSAVYTPKKTDDVARYQVRKLTREGPGAFAAACGEYARNDALRALNETIIENAGRDKKKGVRFARVPTGFETCAFCLMLASRGAVYHTRATAGEFRHFHRRCDCKVVPGFEDDPDAELVQGFKPTDARRRWKRIEDARANSSKLPETPPLHELDGLIKSAWAAHKSAGATEKGYKATVESAVKALVPENPIRVETFANLQGKELQEAIWLAKLGHDVKFRNPNDHKGGNTSDIVLDGSTCDFKKPESNKLKKMTKLITGKLDKQGPEFLIDLTDCEISFEAAEVKCAALLDDERINTIYIAGSGKIECLRK